MESSGVSPRRSGSQIRVFCTVESIGHEVEIGDMEMGLDEEEVIWISIKSEPVCKTSMQRLEEKRSKGKGKIRST